MLSILRGALVLVLVPFGAGRAPAQDAAMSCVTCHGEESKHSTEGVHAAAGITCVTCHGGDPKVLDQARAHGDGFKSLADPLASVEHCGGCHEDAAGAMGPGLRTDQLRLYWTSAHGQALRERGDPNAATCVSCHDAHAIYRSTDPRSSVHKYNQPETCGRCHADDAVMGEYGLSTEVVEEYVQSAHGQALFVEGRLSGPGCADCHGSHGATPARVEAAGRVCGICHSVEQEYFEQSPHLEAARSGAIDECVSCHGSHAVLPRREDISLLGRAGGCDMCHRSESEPAMQVARAMNSALQDLQAELVAADTELREAARRGLVIDRDHEYLADARSVLARMRALSHTCSAQRLEEVLESGRGMLQQTYRVLETKERVQRDRRIFTGILLGVTLLLAAVLQSFRREIHGGWKTRKALEGRD